MILQGLTHLTDLICTSMQGPHVRMSTAIIPAASRGSSLKEKGGRRGYADERSAVDLLLPPPPKGEAKGINNANVTIMMTASLGVGKPGSKKMKIVTSKRKKKV